MTPWNNPDEEWRAPPRDFLSFPRALFRVLALLASVLIALVPFLVLRYGQRLFGRQHSELWVVQLWGKVAIWCFGLKVRIEGEIEIKGGLITSNHINFIDIPLLFSVVPGYMMSKDELRKWPFIGWCARLIGTEFIIRDPAKTPQQVKSLTTRIQRGDRMIIFPEATTTDGQRIIPFRSSFFQAISQVERENVGENSLVQPIAIYYHAPKNASTNFFGFWGDDSFGKRLLHVLESKGRKYVDVRILEPLPQGLGRKEMATTAEALTRQAFEELKAEH